jgi:hypothetical protein
MAQVHIGKKIREVLGRSSFSVTDFADSISVSRSVVYDIFKRSSINTGLLQKIGKVLDHDFFGYFIPENRLISLEERGNYINKNEVLSSLNAELQALRKQVAELEKRCELLEKLNRLQERELLRKKR